MRKLFLCLLLILSLQGCHDQKPIPEPIPINLIHAPKS